MNIFKRVRRFVFGYDIFISYARKDSLDYAYSIARHFMKKEFGYDCYIDQLSSTTPGKTLPGNIVSALQQSTAFIIIGSAGAMHSAAITQEIQNFKKLKSNNPIIPIDIGGKLFEACWYHEIEGLAVIDESPGSFLNQAASGEILERIHNSLNFTKKSKKLRRTAVAFLAFFLLSVAATLFMFREVAGAKKELVKTARQIRYEQMTGMIYLSRVSAATNSITGLKHALKAYTGYRDIDTTGDAEKNLVELYNNNDIIIRTQFSTGGRLSPGGKYLLESKVFHLASQRELFNASANEISFSGDDEIFTVTSADRLRLYRSSDTSLLASFTIADSMVFAGFDARNLFIFVTTEDAIKMHPEQKRVQVLSRIGLKLLADKLIPTGYQVQDFIQTGGGYLLLQSDAGEIGAALYGVTADSLLLLSTANDTSLAWKKFYVTPGNLLLEQSASRTVEAGILKGSKFRFRTRLLEPSGSVLEDSTYTYISYLDSGTTSKAYNSHSNEWLLFGIQGPWGVNFLLNTGKRPFETPTPIKLGFGLQPHYKFISLAGEQYILTVNEENDEYRVKAFRLSGNEATAVLSVANKNHPNGSPGDDRFMKGIDIAYCAGTNFLAIYDRGLGTCTQYYLGKQTIRSAAEFLDLVSKKKIFGENW